MTTTELYSGYTAEGKPSSRVLRPPGGASSNIFGEPDPTPQQQMRQEMAPPVEAQNQSPANPTGNAQSEYQRNKPSGKAEAPFATFAQSGKASHPSQFDSCDSSSQNDADFRCYSVTEYRNAVVQNAATRQRAHGQAAGTFNPITHEESQGSSSPCKDYEQRRPHPQQVAQEQQQPMRMVRGQGNFDKGKVKYNPITGEEYPAEYGQKTNDAEEEQEKDETEETEKVDDAESSNTPDENNSPAEKTATAPAPAVQTPPAPIQKVRQPPGGKSSGLW